MSLYWKLSPGLISVRMTLSPWHLGVVLVPWKWKFIEPCVMSALPQTSEVLDIRDAAPATGGIMLVSVSLIVSPGLTRRVGASPPLSPT